MARGVETESHCVTLCRKPSRGGVTSFAGLTVDMARKCGADALLRGVRSISDFEYERNLADTNREIAELETVFLLSEPQFSFVSSSMVRN